MARQHPRAHRSSAAPRLCETRALLLARTPYGESDLVLQFVTQELGRVSALAQGALRSRRRFAGALEPMHELRITLAERPSAELHRLTEARIEVVRRALLGDLARLEAAGRALGWVRQAALPSTPEPGLYAVVSRLLERLDAPADVAPARELAQCGLRLLVELGWGVELERCVACGKPCERERAAMFDARRGGLMCRACGGARRLLRAGARERMARTAAGEEDALDAGDAELALEIVEETLRAHGGLA